MFFFLKREGLKHTAIPALRGTTDLYIYCTIICVFSGQFQDSSKTASGQFRQWLIMRLDSTLFSYLPQDDLNELFLLSMIITTKDQAINFFMKEINLLYIINYKKVSFSNIFLFLIFMFLLLFFFLFLLFMKIRFNLKQLHLL